MSVSKEAICAMRQEHPDYSMQHIGDLFGVSRERVRQILKVNRLPTAAATVIRPCLVCGKITSNQKYCSQACKSLGRAARYVSLVCETCGITFSRLERNYIKTKKRGYHGIYCSKKCATKNMRHKITSRVMPENENFPVVLTCQRCGKSFTRGSFEVQRKRRRGYNNTYCSRQCFRERSLVKQPT